MLKNAQLTITYSTNQQAIRQATQEGTLSSDTDTASLSGIATVGNFLLIADSDYLSYADGQAVYEVTSETVTPYVDENQASFQQGNGNMQAPDNSGSQSDNQGDTNMPERPDGFVSGSYEGAGDFTLNTFTQTTPTAFEEGTLTLSDGRYATQQEIDDGSLVVLISETLAEDNSLTVGDTIVLTPTIDGLEQDQTYTIIGIYQSSGSEDTRFLFGANSSLLQENQMYVPSTP